MGYKPIAFIQSVNIDVVLNTALKTPRTAVFICFCYLQSNGKGKSYY